MKRERQSEGVLLHAILYSAGEKKKKNKNKKRKTFCLWRRWMISREREREREREEKENLSSSLKIYARVFLYETTHLSYGDADLRYRVFRPFRCTLYSHSYLLYFTLLHVVV